MTNLNDYQNTADGRKVDSDKVFYRGREICECVLQRTIVPMIGALEVLKAKYYYVKIEPKEIAERLNRYEDNLNRENYDNLEEIERGEQCPISWLNFVITRVIEDSLKNKDQPRVDRIVERFRHRGFNEGYVDWIKNGKI